MVWDRKLWGVEFHGSMKEDKPFLLGASWDSNRHPERYNGEPRRALLFCTRAHAREWCRAKMAGYDGSDDIVSKWRFVPVPVMETVVKLTPRSGKAVPCVVSGPPPA